MLSLYSNTSPSLKLLELLLTLLGLCSSSLTSLWFRSLAAPDSWWSHPISPFPAMAWLATDTKGFTWQGFYMTYILYIYTLYMPASHSLYRLHNNILHQPSHSLFSLDLCLLVSSGCLSAQSLWPVGELFLVAAPTSFLISSRLNLFVGFSLALLAFCPRLSFSTQDLRLANISRALPLSARSYFFMGTGNWEGNTSNG